MKKWRALILLLLMILVLFPCAAYGASAVPQAVLDARGSLVRIFCYIGNDTYAGTGFAVGDSSPVDYIITNYHVVEGDGARIEVFISGTISMEASIYRKSESTDLCILKLKNPIYDINPLTIDDSGDAKTGDAIYALGFPGASDSISAEIDASPEDVTLTDGIISAVKSGPLVSGGPSIKLIQINASLNAGNSGGPLLNEKGHVIGINTFTMLGAQNINVAVSVQELLPLLKSSGVSYLTPMPEEPEVVEEAQEAEEDDDEAEATGATQEIETGGFDTPWIIVAGAAVLLAAGGAAVFLVMRTRKRAASGQHGAYNGKKMSFGTYFGDPFRPIETKLSAILAMVEQVSRLHAAGRFGFDICPDNITVADDKAVLRLYQISVRPGMTATRPGYSAPELYCAQGIAGPWSDVYAISAVMYAVTTGQTLPSAFGRSEDVPVFQSGMDERFKGLADAITAGLNVNAQKRPASLDTLRMQLQMLVSGYSAMSCMASGVTADVPSAGFAQAQTTAAPKGRRWSVKKKAIVIPAICLAALLAVCTGLLVMSGINYDKASFYVDSGNYTKADDSLQGVLVFYNDTKQLSKYVQAGIYLDSGRYTEAKKAFEELASFRDSEDMVLETDYRHAHSLLKNGDHKTARAMFAELSDYKDAPDMILESDYLHAVAQMEAGKLGEAEKAFNELVEAGYTDARVMVLEIKYRKALAYIKENNLEEALYSLYGVHPYKDSEALLNQVKADIYAEGMRLLNSGEISLAEDYFWHVFDYREAESYIELCYILSKTDDYILFDREDYEYMLGFVGDVDLSSFLLGDASIFYFLEGKWVGAGHSIEFKTDGQTWSAVLNLPYMKDGYFSVYDGIYTVYESETDNTGKKLYRFSYVSMNVIDVHCYGDGQTYRLFRK